MAADLRDAVDQRLLFNFEGTCWSDEVEISIVATITPL